MSNIRSIGMELGNSPDQIAKFNPIWDYNLQRVALISDTLDKYDL